MRPVSIKYLCLAALACAICVTPGISQKGRSAEHSNFRTIKVVSESGAIVWIDGIRYGRTNKDGVLEIKTVAPGAHTLRLRADGFKDKSQPLAATAKGEIAVTLVKTDDPAELAYQEGERLANEDRERSAAAYRRALKARPNYPDAYIGLARVLLEDGDLEEAGKALAAVRRLKPGHAEASAVEGRLHKESGEETRAITAFKRSIAEGRGFQPEAYTGLGLLYKEKAEGFGGSGDFENETANYVEAAKNLKIALKQLAGAPDTIVIYQLLGLVYERQKKHVDAIATYEEFLRIFPTSAEATAVRSFIVQLKKDMPNQ
ncbi:MAG TPA: tetratricopeptide repeat protein [Pyrinomonadaceae bacterium]|nr:tetratricopeptide repeat protein [Pyrinomonadaceae bacterium]